MSDKEKTNGSLAMAPRVITIPAANQETARKLRVAAYTRVSSNSKDQEHSFAAQNAYGKPPQRGGPAHGLLAGGTGKIKIPLLAVRPLSRQQSH